MITKEEFAKQLKIVIDNSVAAINEFCGDASEYEMCKMVMVNAIYGYIAMQSPARASFKTINNACNKIVFNHHRDVVTVSGAIVEIIDSCLSPNLGFIETDELFVGMSKVNLNHDWLVKQPRRNQ